MVYNKRPIILQAHGTTVAEEGLQKVYSRTMENKFSIEKVTECVEEVATRKIWKTKMLPVSKADLKNVLKKTGWNFPWKSYLKMRERRVYKLVIKDDPTAEIQGLLSFEIMDNYIELHHVENAPHNYAKGKKYAGVCANMVAYACKLIFELNFEGFVSFLAKTALISHYKQTLGAEQVFNSQRMVIPSQSAQLLVNSYYKTED